MSKRNKEKRREKSRAKARRKRPHMPMRSRGISECPGQFGVYHLMIPIGPRTPELTAWVEGNARLLDDYFAELEVVDPSLRAFISLVVHTTGDFLFERAGARADWAELDVRGLLEHVAGQCDFGGSRDSRVLKFSALLTPFVEWMGRCGALDKAAASHIAESIMRCSVDLWAENEQAENEQSEMETGDALTDPSEIDINDIVVSRTATDAGDVLHASYAGFELWTAPIAAKKRLNVN